MISCDKAWKRVWDKFFSYETNLIYDHPIDTIYFPTSEEILCSIPNACGWNTGMEDSMINFGRMLDGIVYKYKLTEDDSLHSYAALLLDGAFKCATISDSEGFLARSILPCDKKSFYIDSSRDQYTHFVNAVVNYMNCGLCTDDERKKISNILISIAKRAEKNVTPENDYHLLRADGKIGIVDKMWEVEPHEALRLPMIYLAAYLASGDEHWLALCYKYRDEAVKQSFNYKKVWHYQIAYQTSISARFMYDYDPDEGYSEKYLELLEYLASLAGSTVLDIAKIVKDEGITFAEPTFNWRGCPMKYSLHSPISEKAYMVPMKPEKYEREHFLFVDAIDSISIQAISPTTKIPSEQLLALEQILEAIDYEKHVNRHSCAIVNLTYLLNARDI